MGKSFIYHMHYLYTIFHLKFYNHFPKQIILILISKSLYIFFRLIQSQQKIVIIINNRKTFNDQAFQSSEKNSSFPRVKNSLYKCNEKTSSIFNCTVNFPAKTFSLLIFFYKDFFSLLSCW